jgi:hypothetical protein
MELFLLAGVLFSLFEGLDGDREALDLARQLFPAPAIACAATFLLTWMVAAACGLVRNRGTADVERAAQDS